MEKRCLKFYFDQTISELFYFLHYLKSLKEEGKEIHLCMADLDDYNLMLPIITELDYIDKFYQEDTYPKDCYSFWYLVDKKCFLNQVNNTNKIIRFYDTFYHIPFKGFYDSWVTVKGAEGIQKDKIILSIDFRHDAVRFDHIHFYEKLLKTFKDPNLFYFIGTDVEFISYNQNNLKGKYKPEYVEFETVEEILKFLLQGHSFIGTVGQYLPMAQALGVPTLVICDNYGVSSLVGNSIQAVNV